MCCRDDVEFINKIVDSTALERLQQVAATPFERVSYSRAIELLEEAVRAKKKKFEYKVGAAADGLLCESRAERLPCFLVVVTCSHFTALTCRQPHALQAGDGDAAEARAWRATRLWSSMRGHDVLPLLPAARWSGALIWPRSTSAT